MTSSAVKSGCAASAAMPHSRRGPRLPRGQAARARGVTTCCRTSAGNRSTSARESASLAGQRQEEGRLAQALDVGRIDREQALVDVDRLVARGRIAGGALPIQPAGGSRKARVPAVRGESPSGSGPRATRQHGFPASITPAKLCSAASFGYVRRALSIAGSRASRPILAVEASGDIRQHVGWRERRGAAWPPPVSARRPVPAHPRSAAHARTTVAGLIGSGVAQPASCSRCERRAAPRQPTALRFCFR